MKKEEFLAISLGKELILQSPYGFRPNGKESTGVFRLIYLTGDLYADIENKTFPEEFIPILHPLSDLTKEIEHNGEKFVPIVKIKELFIDGTEDVLSQSIEAIEYFIENNFFSRIEYLPFILIQKLIDWHFDIAGLIEIGEAIDVNTLPENPYK